MSRTLLTGYLVTFYVDPAGDDTNDGLTASTAFQTLQGAMNTIFMKYDHGGVRLRIQLKTGTVANPIKYAPFSIRGAMTGHYGNPAISLPPTFEVYGDPASPRSVIIESVSEPAVQHVLGKSLHLEGLTIQSINNVGIHAWMTGTEVVTHNIHIGPCGLSRIYCQDQANVRMQQNMTWFGNTQHGLYANRQGLIVADFPITITHEGNVNYSDFLVGSGRQSYIALNGLDFTGGTVTGQRWRTAYMGFIETGNRNPDVFIPGHINGANASGGMCV